MIGKKKSSWVGPSVEKDERVFSAEVGWLVRQDLAPSCHPIDAETYARFRCTRSSLEGAVEGAGGPVAISAKNFEGPSRAPEQ